jgi:hypothetical protein
MLLKVRNSGAGIGDQVCGLYVCQALKNRYPDTKVEYYTRHPAWLADASDVTLRPYEHYFAHPPALTDVYLDSSTRAYRASHPLTRKEIYASRVRLPGLRPIPPVMQRLHSNGDGAGAAILFPFSAWRNREWPVSRWIALEHRLLTLGYRTKVAATADRVQSLDGFKGERLMGLSPGEMVDTMLSAACVVANDSGMAHVAGLYDVPAVAVISTTFSGHHLFCNTGVSYVPGIRLAQIDHDRVADTVLRTVGGRAQRRLVLSPGQFGAISRGGMYNSSIFEVDGLLYMLCRAETLPELGRPSGTTAVPVLVHLSHSFQVVWHRELCFQGRVRPCRIEDFRVFRFRNELLVAHPVVYEGGHRVTRQAVSRLDMDNATLTLIEEPLVPGQQPIEKNWVYFDHDDQLMLLYAPAPYRLFCKSAMGCIPVAEREVHVPWAGGRFVSNSAHPVEVDADSLLLLIHVRREDGVYLQGALRIDRSTLLPTHVSRNPLYCSEQARGLRNGVIYFMGAIRRGPNIIVSMGEGDYYTSVMEFSIDGIMNGMMPLQ